jgi:hypothetical protein
MFCAIALFLRGGQTKSLNPMSYAKVLGAVQTIAKPFTLEKMLALVNKELRR